MAVRPRTGGSMAIEYEDFQPKSEWKEEDGANILLVYLPADFQKEQMKVSYVHSTRIVRVVGERPLAYNKGSRFNQAFPVPQNCDVNKIHARFQNDVLTITMPKATVTPAPKGPKATQEAPIPPPEAAPRRAGKEGSSDEKVMASQNSQKIPSPGEPEAKKPGKEDTATYGSASQKQTDGKKVEGVIGSQEKRDTIDRQAKGKSTEEKGKPTQQVTEEALSSEEVESRKERKESMKITGSDDQESSKKRKESMPIIPGDDQSGAMQKEKGKTSAAAGAGEKQKEDVNATMAKKLKEELKNVTSAAKKTVQGLAMELTSEERQSMVNMGVAILVIAALGAYIYYSYRSSGTGGRAEE